MIFGFDMMTHQAGQPGLAWQLAMHQRAAGAFPVYPGTCHGLLSHTTTKIFQKQGVWKKDGSDWPSSG